MKFLLILIFVFVSCAKEEARSSKSKKAPSQQSTTEKRKIRNQKKIQDLNGTSIFDLASELFEISKNEKDLDQFIKELDANLNIECNEKCKITKKENRK